MSEYCVHWLILFDFATVVCFCYFGKPKYVTLLDIFKIYNFPIFNLREPIKCSVNNSKAYLTKWLEIEPIFTGKYYLALLYNRQRCFSWTWLSISRSNFASRQYFESSYAIISQMATYMVQVTIGNVREVIYWHSSMNISEMVTDWVNIITVV